MTTTRAAVLRTSGGPTTIEDLVVAYEKGQLLLQAAEARLEKLGREAGVPV